MGGRRKNEDEELEEYSSKGEIASGKDDPKAHTAYLTTMDGAFDDDPLDETIVKKPLAEDDADEQYGNLCPAGAHDAVGKAGRPKGSVLFGEGDAAMPHAFDMADRDEGKGPDIVRDSIPEHAADQEPVSIDAVDDTVREIEQVAGKRGRHRQHSAPDLPNHEVRSLKMRKTLVVVIVVLAVLVVALVVASGYLFNESRNAALSQSAAQSENANAQRAATAESAETLAAQKADIPDLTAIIGVSEENVLSTVGHGAVISSQRDIDDEANPIKRELDLSLTDEPASTSGYPTVYIGLDESGKVAMAGYSASMASFGYGRMSFADAIAKEHVVEHALEAAGVSVDAGSLTLPNDESAYATYAADRTTLTRESLSFSGETTVNGYPATWSAVISYDFTAANASGDLSGIIRQLYLYVNA